MEEYELASTGVAYEVPGEQVPMVFMDTGGLFHDGNDYHWWEQKQPPISQPNLLREQ